MTNSGAAQNEVGKLFVDIGIGGLGKTLKALNSVSASFLLTKNAAVQMAKPLIDMGMKAASNAVGIGKLAAALGTTKENAQKLNYYLKQYRSEDLAGDVANIANKFTDIWNHQGAVDGLMARSMSQLGLRWQNYSGSFEDTLKFIMDVKKQLKTMNLDKNVELMHLRNLGLQKFQYLFEKPDFNIEEAAKVLQEEIESEEKLDEEIQKLRITIDQFKQKFVSTLLDSGLLTNIGKIADWAANHMDDAKNLAGDVSAAAKTLNPTIPLEKKVSPVATTTYNAFGLVGALMGQEGFMKNLYLSMAGVRKNPQTGELIYPQNFPKELMNKVNSEYTSTNINITNNNNITGSNAEEISDKVIDKTDQYKTYAKANQPSE